MNTRAKLRFFNGKSWEELAEKGKDGYTPRKGVDYFDGKNGKNGSPDTPRQIKEKLKELPIEERWFDARHIKGLPMPASSGKGRIVKGAGSPLSAYDLSAQLDGSTKTFTIPANNGVILVVSSSTPFTFRPLIDYVVSGTSLIFDSAIDAPSMLASGQSLIVIYAS